MTKVICCPRDDLFRLREFLHGRGPGGRGRPGGGGRRAATAAQSGDLLDPDRFCQGIGRSYVVQQCNIIVISSSRYIISISSQIMRFLLQSRSKKDRKRSFFVIPC